MSRWYMRVWRGVSVTGGAVSGCYMGCGGDYWCYWSVSGWYMQVLEGVEKHVSIIEACWGVWGCLGVIWGC